MNSKLDMVENAESGLGVNATKQLEAIKPSFKTSPEIEEVCQQLRSLQRERTVILKTRNMQSNRLQAIVAASIGYSNTMSEKDRTKKFKEASSLIKSVVDNDADTPMKMIIKVSAIGIDAFNRAKEDLEKRMLKLVKQLPVYQWISHKNQRGFGPLFLAIIVGETGNLANYANPGKLWARMGCAPYTFPTLPDGTPAPDSHTLMGATWRSAKFGKLPASEWELYGYSPRRRSIAYLVGEGIVKQNFIKPSNSVVVGTEIDESQIAEDTHVTVHDSVKVEVHKSSTDNIPGPYRRRYNVKKADIKMKHPEYSDLRCHRHGMLLATKLLLKNLWLEWNSYPPETKTWMTYS